MKTNCKIIFPLMVIMFAFSACKEEMLDESPCTFDKTSELYLLGIDIIDTSSGGYSSYMDGSTRVFKFKMVAADVCTEAPVSAEFRVALLDTTITGINARGKVEWQLFFEEKCDLTKTGSELKCNRSDISIKDAFGGELSGWFTHSIEIYFPTKGSYYADTQFLRANVISVESMAKYREYKDTPCHCLNGGTCVNGICQCPPGFTGDTCQTPVGPPKKMIIDSVKLNCFPVDNNGTPWDTDGSPADIRLSINKTDRNNISLPPTTNEFYSSQTFNDQSSSPFIFTNDFPYTINQPDTQYYVALWNDNNPDPPTLVRNGIFVNFFHWASPDYLDTMRVSAGTFGCNYPNFLLYVTWEY